METRGCGEEILLRTHCLSARTVTCHRNDWRVDATHHGRMNYTPTIWASILTGHLACNLRWSTYWSKCVPVELCCDLSSPRDYQLWTKMGSLRLTYTGAWPSQRRPGVCGMWQDIKLRVCIGAGCYVSNDVITRDVQTPASCAREILCELNYKSEVGVAPSSVQHKSHQMALKP